MRSNHLQWVFFFLILLCPLLFHSYMVRSASPPPRKKSSNIGAQDWTLILLCPFSWSGFLLSGSIHPLHESDIWVWASARLYVSWTSSTMNQCVRLRAHSSPYGLPSPTGYVTAGCNSDARQMGPWCQGGRISHMMQVILELWLFMRLFYFFSLILLFSDRITKNKEQLLVWSSINVCILLCHVWDMRYPVGVMVN